MEVSFEGQVLIKDTLGDLAIDSHSERIIEERKAENQKHQEARYLEEIKRLKMDTSSEANQAAIRALEKRLRKYQNIS